MPHNVVGAVAVSNTHQIAQIAYPNNSNLGNVYLLYDAYGRQATVQKGTGGPTVTTRYDALDRVTGIAYSDGTPTVSYGYDAAGKVKTMTDASGTTTYGHDGLGRLTSCNPLPVAVRSSTPMTVWGMCSPTPMLAAPPPIPSMWTTCRPPRPSLVAR